MARQGVALSHGTAASSARQSAKLNPLRTDRRPAWLDRDAPVEPPPVRPLSPSGAYDEATLVRRAGAGNRAERKKAMARGVLMHRLLQSLPDIARAARAEAARRHLARTAASFTPRSRRP